MFSCQKAATSTFLNLYFYPWIYQELQCEGKYNVTTQICEEEGNYKVDKEEEEVEKIPSSSASATSSSSTPTLATDPIPINLRKPFLQFHTIKPPSCPYGDMCPFEHLYGLYPELNNTKYSIICVAYFPNLLVYGVLSYWNTYRHDHWISNISFPLIRTWLKMLPLGMKHYKFPIILTGPLPQPWATIDSRLPDRNIPDPPFLKGQFYFCTVMNILQPYNSTNNSWNPIHFDNTHLNGTTRVEASSKLSFICTINVTSINVTSFGIKLPLLILLPQIGLASTIT
jgi:hypothetical protein